MSRRRRNAYSSYYGSRGGSRGLADWFGLLALLCMLVCSVILLVRVLGAGVLTTVLTVVLILVLVLLNGLHAFVQLPVRRNVAGKLICAVVALVLSAAMIFTSTAAGSLMKFLSNVTSGGSAKTTTCVVSGPMTPPRPSTIPSAIPTASWKPWTGKTPTPPFPILRTAWAR